MSSSVATSPAAVGAHPHLNGHMASHRPPRADTAGPIAAAVLPKPRQTSLLTTALGGTAGTPVHPFLSNSQYIATSGTPHVQGDAGQLEQVLDTWDRVWMGPVVSSSQASSVSPACTPTSPVISRGATHLASTTPAHVPAPLPVPTAATSTSPRTSTSSTPILRESPMPALPATPPPAHRPLSLAAVEGIAPTAVAKATPIPQAAASSPEPSAQPIAIAASTSYRSSGATLSNSNTTARPIQVHHPVIPKNAKDSNDFASVFFSPLPYSYLSMARSDSTDQIALNGSPDVTVRNGRLATSSASMGGPLAEWPDADPSPGLHAKTLSEVAELSVAAAAAANGGSRLSATSRSSSAQDVTNHGHKRRMANGTSSLSPSQGALLGTSAGLSLTSQHNSLLAQAVRATEAASRSSTSDDDGADTTARIAFNGTVSNGAHGAAPIAIAVAGKPRGCATPSPDSPLADAAAHAVDAVSPAPPSQPPAAAGTGGGVTTVLSFSAGIPAVNGNGVASAKEQPGVSNGGGHPLLGQLSLQRPPSRAGDAPGDSPLLLRAPSPRPSPPPPPFSSHPAVASFAHPLIPGPDLFQASGYSSIAAALESQAQVSVALRLIAAAAMIPHVDKADKGGEDAFCIVHSGLGSIGVADGVSGWAEEGIDPAEYSRTLMRFCSEALHEAGTSADAREVIRYAHKSTVMAGSSTVSLAVMKPQGRLQVANLGDSGVRIIRDGRIIFASAAQQHMFNMPYQLSHPSIIDSPDDADSADVTLVDVLPGDIIVMATDGLYDNMFDEEIAAICSDVIQLKRRQLMLGAGSSGDAAPSAEQVAAAAAQRSLESMLYTLEEAEALAQRITRTAHRYAQNPYQRTPWSVASCEQGYGWARYFAKGGGKMDDCTVIVSFVQPDNVAPDAPVPSPLITQRPMRP